MKDAFIHFVTVLKKQNADTVEFHEDIYSYRTKRGLVKEFRAFSNSDRYFKKRLHLNKKFHRVNGFIFEEYTKDL